MLSLRTVAGVLKQALAALRIGTAKQATMAEAAEGRHLLVAVDDCEVGGLPCQAWAYQAYAPVLDRGWPAMLGGPAQQVPVRCSLQRD